MNGRNFRNGWIVGVALVFAGLACGGLARGNGREFSGFYRISDASVSGETVSLTLTLRLFNHSGADVSNATVMLRDRIIPSQNYGTFASVKVPAGRAVQLSGTFQISQHEYQSWQQGRQPFLMIEYADAAGNKVRRPIEIARSPIRPEAKPEPRPEARPEVR
jgi:hypothetical protein